MALLRKNAKEQLIKGVPLFERCTKREIAALAAEAGDVFDQVARLEADGRIILVVNPQALLDRAERDLLAELEAAATDPATR